MASRIQEAQAKGISAFVSQDLSTQDLANDRVRATWELTYESDTGLSAFGHVVPVADQDSIDLVVVAFTSPDYSPDSGTYYAGCFVGEYGEAPLPGGTGKGFILQSQQFTTADLGKTIEVHLSGWVDTSTFSFTKTIVLGE